MQLLYISAHFPPCAASGVFRVLGFIRWLHETGWTIAVLALHTIEEERLDPELLERVPGEVRVYKTGYVNPFSLRDALKKTCRKRQISSEEGGETKKQGSAASMPEYSWKDSVSYLLKTPDSYLGWLPMGILCALLKISRPDVILATAPPFSAFVMATILKFLWRVPLVVDFRDPWVNNPLRAIRPGWAGKLDGFLERMVLRNADVVILNTDEARRLYQHQYPDQASRMHTVTNGFDSRFTDIAPASSPMPDMLWIVYVGALYGKRSPNKIIEAVLLFDDIILDLFGPGVESYLELASDRVRLSPQVTHQGAVALQKGADVTLVIGNCLEQAMQIPAKVFEVMALAKNIWLIDSSDSPARRLLREAGLPHYYSTPTYESIFETLRQMHIDWRGKKISTNRLPEELIQQFDRRILAEQLGQLLNSVIEP